MNDVIGVVLVSLLLTLSIFDNCSCVSIADVEQVHTDCAFLPVCTHNRIRNTLRSGFLNRSPALHSIFLFRVG